MLSQLINVNGVIVRIVFDSLQDFRDQIAELFGKER